MAYCACIALLLSVHIGGIYFWGRGVKQKEGKDEDEEDWRTL